MNSKLTPSHHLSPEAVKNITDAADFSCYIGKPLNRFISIHCQRAGIEMNKVHNFRISFLKHAGDWLRLRGVPLCCIWVLENPSAGGLNLHILMHVPPEHSAQFAHRQRGWLRAAGATCRAKVILTKPIGPRRWERPHPYIGALTGLVLYLLKGASPETCDELSTGDVTLDHVDQGVIVGKRAGVSEAIGPSARAKFPVPRFEFRGQVHLRPLQPMVLAYAGDWWTWRQWSPPRNRRRRR